METLSAETAQTDRKVVVIHTLNLHLWGDEVFISLCSIRVPEQEPMWLAKCDTHGAASEPSSLGEAASVFANPDIWCSHCERLTAARKPESLL